MSTGTIPQKAFILAAGKGQRLQPYTDTMPKPLVPVRERPIIDYTLDHLEKIGVSEVTINLHYRAAQLQQHLSARTAPHLTFSHETTLLDTGGGIRKALYTMGDMPFFCFSGDTLWEDGPSGNTLERLAGAWDDSRMDLLFLLQPLHKMTVTQGSGDYDFAAGGRIIRNRSRAGAFFWPSIRIIHPRLFAGTPEDQPFSFLDLMDKAEAADRLYGIVHDGICHHITTADDLHRVNTHFLQQPAFQAGPKVA